MVGIESDKKNGDPASDPDDSAESRQRPQHRAAPTALDHWRRYIDGCHPLCQWVRLFPGWLTFIGAFHRWRDQVRREPAP